MSSKQTVLVLSGYNIRAVIAFCRWATAHEVDFYIVARDEQDPIFLTEYKEKVFIVRESLELRPDILRSWIEILIKQHHYQRVLILPVSEYFNRFLLRNRSAIEMNDCVIPLVDETIYKTISDKIHFARLCDSYGLMIPREFEGLPPRLPFVAKPRTYFSIKGHQLIPYLIRDESDLQQFLANEETADFFFQEFVQGQSFYLLAYISESGHDRFFSQENLMQQSGGKSIILARQSDFHRSHTAHRYVEMLHNVGFSGLIMVEVRRDSVGRDVMIEANPRLWGPMQFIVDNDIDLFGRMLEAYGFEIFEPNGEQRFASHYFWSGGITEAAQPVAFFNYSAEQFVADFPFLRVQDIFFRADTLNLFLHEAGMVDAYGI
jgi:predicted ATP-grasp superfamily ATP-dependent carboligase